MKVAQHCNTEYQMRYDYFIWSPLSNVPWYCKLFSLKTPKNCSCMLNKVCWYVITLFCGEITKNFTLCTYHLPVSRITAQSSIGAYHNVLATYRKLNDLLAAIYEKCVLQYQRYILSCCLNISVLPVQSYLKTTCLRWTKLLAGGLCKQTVFSKYISTINNCDAIGRCTWSTDTLNACVDVNNSFRNIMFWSVPIMPHVPCVFR